MTAPDRGGNGRALVGAAALLVLLFAAWAAWALWDGTRTVSSEERMLTVLHQITPPGTPTERARHSLERRGFLCVDVRGGDWVTWGGQAVRRGIDFVGCERADGFITGTFWRVGLAHSGGTVTEILLKARREGL